MTWFFNLCYSLLSVSVLFPVVCRFFSFYFFSSLLFFALLFCLQPIFVRWNLHQWLVAE